MNATEIKQFWDENGYYHARGVFNAQEVAQLQDDFDHIVQQLQASGESINARWGGAEMEKIDGGNSVIFHTHNVQNYSAHWLCAMQHDGFLDVVQALIGPDIILHHSKLFQKPAEKGSPFPMHQDWGYFPTETNSMLAGVIHVSRATNEMGCLRVYPGSHKLGRLQDSMGQSQDGALDEYPLENATTCEAEAGDVVFFNYLTLHGSMPNRSDEVRKTVLIQMHAGADKVEDGNTHPNCHLTLRGWNHAMNRETANSVG